MGNLSLPKHYYILKEHKLPGFFDIRTTNVSYPSRMHCLGRDGTQLFKWWCGLAIVWCLVSDGTQLFKWRRGNSWVVTRNDPFKYSRINIVIGILCIIFRLSDRIVSRFKFGDRDNTNTQTHAHTHTHTHVHHSPRTSVRCRVSSIKILSLCGEH